MVYETLDAVQRASRMWWWVIRPGWSRFTIQRLEDFVRLPYDEALRAELFGTQTAAEPYDS